MLLEWGESKRLFELTDVFLLAPADAPLSSPEVISAIRAEWVRHPDSIIVPVHEGHRGHPTLFPHSLRQEIYSVPTDQGLNWLGRSGRMPVRECEFADSGEH